MMHAGMPGGAPGDWFSDLFGFGERARSRSASEIRQELRLDGRFIESVKNGRRYQIGEFGTPSLAELRGTLAAEYRAAQAANNLRDENRIERPTSSDPHRAPQEALERPSPSPGVRRLRLHNVVGDVVAMHAHPANRHATFQVASQLNCLEFVSQHIVPEDGVTGYAFDRTQGPACAIACGPATVYRNYFVPMDGGVGQSRDAQINNLADVEARLANDANDYWRVQGGYTMAGSDGLQRLNARLAALDERELDELRAALRVGVHRDAEVTSTGWGRNLLGAPEQTVTQVLGSACAVAYNAGASRPHEWAPLASLVLEAGYEATLLAAALSANARGWERGSARVYLTLLGGGVFGNEIAWITRAIERACDACADLPLDVRIVTYSGQIPAALKDTAARYGGGALVDPNADLDAGDAGAVGRLCEMGFERERVSYALAQHRGDENAALNALLSG